MVVRGMRRMSVLGELNEQGITLEEVEATLSQVNGGRQQGWISWLCKY